MGTMIKSHVVTGKRVDEDIDSTLEDGNKKRTELQFDMYEIDGESRNSHFKVEMPQL